MKTGIAIYINKSKRIVLEKIINDFDERKLEDQFERYWFKELKKQLVGKYHGETYRRTRKKPDGI